MMIDGKQKQRNNHVLFLILSFTIFYFFHVFLNYDFLKRNIMQFDIQRWEDYLLISGIQTSYYILQVFSNIFSFFEYFQNILYVETQFQSAIF